MRRSFVILNVGLAVTLAGVVAAAALAVGDPTATATTTTPTVKVSRGTLTATVSASGNLSAKTSVVVNFPSNSGTVTAIEVTLGQVVKAGDVLATSDDTSARLTLASAEASLASAEAQLMTTTQEQTSKEKASSAAQVGSSNVAVGNSRTALTQAQATYAQDKVTQDALVAAAQATYDNATDATSKANAQTALTQAKNTRDSTLLRDSQSIQTAGGSLTSAQASLVSAAASAAVNAQGAKAGAVASATAQIASAQATVDQAQSTLDHTILRAPVGGTVVSIAGTVGGPSSAGSTSTTSSSTSGFVVLSSMSNLQVTTMVAEADAAKVQVGQKATVSFSALGTSASGSVTAIDLTQTITNNVVEYGVTVLLDAPPAGVRLGQTSSVSIVTATRDNVLSVPSSAITKTGPVSTVTLRKDGLDVVTTVQTGLVGDSGTEITSGLSEGDQVVISSSTTTGGSFTFPGGGFGGGLSR